MVRVAALVVPAVTAAASGMAVAIGLVIDDAVVVVENIHRRVSAGGDLAETEDATHELVAPIVGSTLTTVVVFVPLALLSGVVGDFFKALSITLSVAVLISLVLSLTLIPLLSRVAHRHSDHTRSRDARLSGLNEFYARTLPWMLGRPVFVFGAVIVLAAIGVASYTAVGTGFFPAADEGGFVIDYLTAPGMTLEETNARLATGRSSAQSSIAELRPAMVAVEAHALPLSGP